jgi:hypothetical protein
LYGLDDVELQKNGAIRYSVTNKPGFPCRVSLEDCEIGDSAILLNYEHQPTDSPYRSRHAIFVKEGAETARLDVDEIPEMLRIRNLSVRSFNRDGMMLDADVVVGDDLNATIRRMFASDETDYIHVHNAARGCFDATVIRE